MVELIPFLRKDEIDKMVRDVGRQICTDYQGRDLVMIGVLKGAFIFMSDLMRHLTIPVEADFIRAASYGSGTSSSGNIRLTKEPETDLKEMDVLVTEDIIDTGLTLEYIVHYLASLGPRTLKICTLLDKQERRVKDVPIDYAGCKVEKGFLVGYGLDYAEKYRNLPEIYDLKL